MGIFGKKQTNDGLNLNYKGFHILASLSKGRKHGYGIARDIWDSTDHKIDLTIASLYENIDKLRNDGFIEPDGEETVNGRVRKMWKLTGEGYRAAQEYQRLINSAGLSDHAPGVGGAAI